MFCRPCGVGHLAFGNPGAALVAAEIERFLKDLWEAGGWEEEEPDRLLATALFTDMVGSTAQAAELRDPAWRGPPSAPHAPCPRGAIRFPPRAPAFACPRPPSPRTRSDRL